MALGEGASMVVANGVEPVGKPIQLALSLRHSPDTRVHLHLTVLRTCLMLFVTTASSSGGQSGATMGTLVYAMPDRYNPSQPISTTLYASPSSVDLATRLAKVLVRRTSRPCYVGGSLDVSSAAGGGTVEEEMETFRAVVDSVVAEVAKIDNATYTDS